MSLSIPRVLAVAGLLLGAAVLLTGCPQPNAYTVRRAFRNSGSPTWWACSRYRATATTRCC